MKTANTFRRIGAFALLFAALVGTTAHAGGRPDGSSRNWFGFVDGGYAFTSGETSDFLDDSFSFGGGAMYWPSNWPVGLVLDVDYWQMDLTNRTIDAINDAIDSDPGNSGEITGGDVENWQFGLSGVLSLGPDTNEGFYLTGGVSWNSLTGRVTNTGLVYYPPICDPWLWWCVPGGVGPGTIIRGQRSSDEIGWNVGVGYSFRNVGSQLYVELAYERVEFESDAIEYIPLTVGFRW